MCLALSIGTIAVDGRDLQLCARRPHEADLYTRALLTLGRASESFKYCSSRKPICFALNIGTMAFARSCEDRRAPVTLFGGVRGTALHAAIADTLQSGTLSRSGRQVSMGSCGGVESWQDVCPARRQHISSYVISSPGQRSSGMTAG